MADAKKLLHVLFVVTLIVISYLSLRSGARDSFFKSKDTEVCESENCDKDGESESSIPPPVDGDTPHINIMITFYNAESNHKLIKTFTVTIRSLLQHTSVPLVIHIIGDRKSQDLAAKIIQENNDYNKTYKVRN